MLSLQDYHFEWLNSEKLPLANKFYQRHGIRGKVGRNDRCAILRDHRLEMVAVAVLKAKSGFELLAHVAVIDHLRRQGLACYLLSFMAREFTCSTYCFPFTYLEALYLTQGFVRINKSKTPANVLNLYQVYRQQGRDILLMGYQPQ